MNLWGMLARFFGNQRARENAFGAGNVGLSPPRVEYGSTLDTLATLNPDVFDEHVAMLLIQIDDCLRNESMEYGPVHGAYESLHALKNVIVATGSRTLLQGCERLRVDVSRSGACALLRTRYAGLANATKAAIEEYVQNRRSLKVDHSPDAN